MRRFLVRRLTVAVLVIVTVSFVGFSLLRLSGNLAAVLAGEGASPHEVARVAAQYGLDRPFFVQYLDWAANALRGNLGKSLFTGESVSHLLATHIGVTATLALCSLALGLAIAIPLGVFAATRPNSWLDRASLTLAASGYAIPSFWLSLILIYIFGVRLRWLPTSGSDGWTHFVLPTIALGIATMPAIMRLTRAGMLEVLSADYVRTARAKGLPSLSVLYKHALPNAILPVVSIAAAQLGMLLGGSVIIESVFALNGVGLLAFQAIANADFPVVQSILIFLSAVYVVLTLIAELINAKLDPRIRL
jgi:ABC-type dipeptide/oligopeptide/nickel transport system permease component